MRRSSWLGITQLLLTSSPAFLGYRKKLPQQVGNPRQAIEVNTLPNGRRGTIGGHLARDPAADSGRRESIRVEDVHQTKCAHALGSNPLLEAGPDPRDDERPLLVGQDLANCIVATH